MPPGTKAEARLLFNEAVMLAERGGEFDLEARRLAEDARRLNAQLGDRLGGAYVLALEGDLASDPATAAEAYDQALAVARQHQDALLEASLLHRLGQQHRITGDFEAAAAKYDEALAVYERAADPVGQAIRRFE
jgi:tetratricopeptide (TPR) repeat protein